MPDKAEEMLASKKAIDINGDFIPANVFLAYPMLKLLGQDYVEKPLFNTQLVTGDTVLDRTEKMLAIGQPVLLHVKLGSNLARSNHWVVASPQSGPLVIMDPWFGDMVPFASRYGDPAHQIFGAIRFFGPVTDAPNKMLMNLSFKAYEMMQASGHPELQYKIDTYSKEVFNDILGI